jgi:hypothetical protein
MAQRPRRDVRIEDDLWDPLAHTAKAMGTNTSAFLRVVITAWRDGRPPPPPIATTQTTAKERRE